MEENNRQEKPMDGNETQQSLGRMLVPVGQPAEEPVKRKRKKNGGSNDRRRLIVHWVILVVLLGVIVFGLYYFLHEESGPGVPPMEATQADSTSVATE